MPPDTPRKCRLLIPVVSYSIQICWLLQFLLKPLKAVHKTVHLVKFIGKGCSIFFECLHYATLIVLQDIMFIKYCMVPTWQYINRTKLYNFLLVQILIGVLLSVVVVLSLLLLLVHVIAKFT